ncbi:Importin subunit alpha-8 [Lemmus lemmus]
MRKAGRCVRPANRKTRLLHREASRLPAYCRVLGVAQDVLPGCLSSGGLPRVHPSCGGHWGPTQGGSLEFNVMTSFLRTVGNVVTEPDQQTQKTIDAGMLRYWASSQSTKVQKEAVWTMSNVAAGSKHHICS